MARLRRLWHNWLSAERGDVPARFFLIAIAAVILTYLGLYCCCPLSRQWSDVATVTTPIVKYANHALRLRTPLR